MREASTGSVLLLRRVLHSHLGVSSEANGKWLQEAECGVQRVRFSRLRLHAPGPKMREATLSGSHPGHTPRASGFTSDIAGRRPDYQSGCQVRPRRA